MLNWRHAFAGLVVFAAGAFADPTTAPADRPFLLSKAVFPIDISDEAAYETWLQSESARLAAAADDAAATEADRIEAHLALANWLLSTRLEPAASRVALGLHGDDDRPTIRRVASEAIERLDQARSLIDSYHPVDPTAADDAAEGWEEARETLEVFANGLAALGESGDDGSEKRRAAVNFALYVDDSRRHVALAARLWQAVLLLDAGEAERAVRALKPTLEPMADPFPEFYLRLLRVRAALAAAPKSDAGRFATAIALLLRLEERCERTFESPEAALLAERTCVVLRAQLAREWRAALESADNAKAASAVGELSQDASDDDGPLEILRLRRAVPILITAGGVTTTDEAPSTEESDDAGDEEMDDHSDDGADDDESGDEDGPVPEM